MATAYLLAYVLTLIVVLVQGQKAIHEKEIQVKTDKLVEVADDIFEDELNSDIDFLLLDSANTRAECNQKKKCKNKGGTCQNKGNACAGKSVKGCSKGCSCCLPEEILCKPSKKCKRANGACISRSECNGKIVAKGCKKPKNCKRTHVCCVQDETTTEVPTCRGPSCPLPDECPNQVFVDKHVCSDCKRDDPKQKDVVLKFLNGKDKSINPYTVFYGDDFDGKKITFKPSNDGSTCLFEKSVQAWNCVFDRTLSKPKWKCHIQGFCTGVSTAADGKYSATSLVCNGCPNPIFVENHVCTDCETPDSACQFTKTAGRDITIKTNNVFGGSAIKYKPSQYYDLSTQKVEKSCLIEEPVKSWTCEVEEGEWKKSTDLGTCIGQSRLANGHSYDKSIICYKVNLGKFWDEKCDTLQTIIIDPDTAENCMKKCTKNSEDGFGCNAFNYKLDENCILKACSTPYPIPISKEGYNAYYRFPEPTAARSNVADDKE